VTPGGGEGGAWNRRRRVAWRQERHGKVLTLKKQRDLHETKDAVAKQQTQTQMPQMQAHDDCAQEVEEHD
jgi:hypothetical protein